MLLIIIGWLVGNAVFSETARSISLVFCMKLGDYKRRKVTEMDFFKKKLIWRYLGKHLQIRPKSGTLIFFSKMATIFLIFGLKLVQNMTFNLNETYFSEKIAIWQMIDGHDVLLLSYNSPAQPMYSCLRHKTPKEIPIIFHNGSTFDYHFITKH